MIGNEERCCGSAYHGRMGSFQCTRRGVVKRNGKPYCKQHDPVEKEKKRIAWDENFKAERIRDEQIWMEAERLAKLLGVNGRAEFGQRYSEYLVISFADAEKLIQRLGQPVKPAKGGKGK